MPSFSPSSKGVCVPKGFSSAGIACGIKEPSSPKKDLALILSEVPCQAAGVFTRNKVSAAPIHLCKQHLQKGASSTARAILVNSGNANACTGKQGDEDARAMAELAAETVGCQSHQIFIASTGIIGIPLPLERIRNQVGSLQASLQTESSQDAAEAIMTSDTRPKIQALASENFSVGGIAKGAGMICPNMATMLAFVTTDAQITAEEADRMLRIAVDQSFNRITIDGDMSTNDTVLLLANGLAGRPNLDAFQSALNEVTQNLAKQIVRDGERVTKFVEVQVSGAANDSDAQLVAQAVANSNLVKSSWNGNDPNWGRIIHAVGYAGAEVVPDRIDISFNDLPAAIGGMTAKEAKLEDLVAAVTKPEFQIQIRLGMGDGTGLVYASDLSPEYVDFNRAEYAATLAKKRQEG